MPVTFQLGASDNKWFGDGFSYPLAGYDSLLTHPKFQGIINAHAQTFDFETNYTLKGDIDEFLVATFKGIPDQGNRNFQMILVDSMGHNYPNGKNHPVM